METAVQNDSVTTCDNEAQTEEIPCYVPLVRKAFIRKLQNELTGTT